MGSRVILAAGLVVAAVAIDPATTWAAAKKNSVDSARWRAKLSSDEKILHALNRLTFGPRQSDLAQVRNIGLNKWIDLQLHPSRIAENPELEAKLQPLDTLRM